MHATTLDRIAEQAPTMTEAQRNWRNAAIALMSTRFIQGFIYWGGGSRRFIYAPSKLDPSAPSWMANKFQTAMPGALFGTDHLISFMLHHFWLLYAGVILFSAAERVVGAMVLAAAARTRSTTSCSVAPRRWQKDPGFAAWRDACRCRSRTLSFVMWPSRF